jgi:hypothetical protein
MPNRTPGFLVPRLVGGLAAVVVIVTFGSVAINTLAAPKQFDLYRPVMANPSCEVRDDGKGVILVMTIEPKPAMDPEDWRVRAEEDGATSAAIEGIDVWDAKVGFGEDDMEPTTAMTDLLWRREWFDPATTQFVKGTPRNIAIAIAPAEAGERIEFGPVKLVTATGEPEYFQTIPIVLHSDLKSCVASVGTIAPE